MTEFDPITNVPGLVHKEPPRPSAYRRKTLDEKREHLIKQLQKQRDAFKNQISIKNPWFTTANDEVFIRVKYGPRHLTGAFVANNETEALHVFDTLENALRNQQFDTAIQELQQKEFQAASKRKS